MDSELSSSQENVSNSQIELEDVCRIEPINRKTVHRICSGQVVLSLAIAVKELVENAIDASATNIEVRLKDYGSELLEVNDNGSGVRKEHFQALTLKHYTSKLKEFSDLESIETLGFRGEALSSLCALSNLTVITRHATAEHATKIQYDLNGKIISELPAARDFGTTVILENLFSTLPVRRKEFTKNLKREYSKMCQLLYAYCLVSKGIKFSCTNQTQAGSRCTVVATEGSNSVRENIISIFGSKQIPSLVEVEMIEPEEKILEEYKVKIVAGESLPFKFECITSSAMHGSGRSTSDRQFFYINSRPCEPSKITKLINEVYRQFNPNQYPFVFLNIEMQRSLVDVNVTPDKRQIFLEKEKLLLAVLKTSLLEAFKSSPSTYKVQNLQVTNDICNQTRSYNETRGVKRTLGDMKCKSEENEVKEGNIFELFQKRSKRDSTVNRKSQNQSSLTNNKNFNITIKSVSPDKDLESASSDRDLEKLISFAHELEERSDSQTDASFSCEPSQEQMDCKSQITDVSESINIEDLDIISQSSEERVDIKKEIEDNSESFNLGEQDCLSLEDITIDTISEIKTKLKSVLKKSTISFSEDTDKPQKKTVTVRSSMKYLKEALKSCQLKETDEAVQVRFRSQINPAANKSAEQELQKQMSKDRFKEMSIIGQFNLGFIITKLENDLFIIDQHATDEKYNFEQLQLTTVLESQILVNPKPLELTAANEDILIENEEVFRKNGFKFLIDCNAPATKKVSLTAIPISKNWVFGKDDIEEMLFMLQEDVNHAVCRPSRVRAMFANRACRKSVMVGCPLTQTDMKRLVDHMGQIDQPWNCPHGRPTMRHLVNLQLVENT